MNYEELKKKADEFFKLCDEVDELEKLEKLKKEKK